ncbi:MAG: hypothetical protein CMC79_04840 [Flavobacteriaceae bacterium]|nr:hypothetical protein [Flavobacteriaceae bacterium]|tara:strand:- start:7318 stop:8742 length:1425 start_codon:yes stop_codon:yes gene_type:complete
MKKIIYNLILSLSLLFIISCEDIVEGINDNPNDIIVTDVEERLFLTGAQLANVQINCGHLNRIGGMYSGQLIGYTSLYSNIYGFSLSTAESNDEWFQIYVGVLSNTRHIANNSSNQLLIGISKIIEGHALGTGASLFGDIPFSEAGNPEISDPVFDSQIDVYAGAISLLDEGISILNSASSGSIAEDIYFGGDKSKWVQAAYTLKARFYLHQKDYGNALTAAQNGISSSSGDMMYKPPGAAGSGDRNLFWTILEGSRSGDIGNSDQGESYLIQMLDASNPLSRNNAKTDETARKGFYTIDSTSGSANTGIIEMTQPQNMVTFFENELILAECKARNGTLESGLPHLNNVRAWLNSGAHLNSNFQGEAYSYLAYDAADFASGGIENADGIDAKTAFLREVIEERYVSGFGMHMPYNDSRRLRKSDTNMAVPYVLFSGPQSGPWPERMPYANNELNSNSNAPDEDPGIFVTTRVNQ